MDTLSGRSAIVTGGGSGIGRAIATLLTERGARVTILDRDADAAALVRSELAGLGDVTLAIGDASDPAFAAKAVDETVARAGTIDILVNNAGGGRLLPTEAIGDDDWRGMQAANIDTTFFMSRAALKPMLAAGRGAIVNICSVHGHVGLANHAAYGAAKGAVANLTRAMAVEFAGRGIRINAVSPGVIRTPALDAAGPVAAKGFIDLHPIGRLGLPREVAQAVCFLASDQASFITGANLMVDGGFTAQ